MIVNRVCQTSTKKTKNFGGKKQCLEAPTKTMARAKRGFAFDNETDANDPVKWKEAIVAKNLIPFPNIEGLENANTEATIKNGRYTDYPLKDGVAGNKYRFDLSTCNYDALKSQQSTEYPRVFEITEADEVTCEVQEDGTVKGRLLSSFIVGIRNRPTDEDVAYTDVNLKFSDDIFDIIKPSFEVTELEGVFDVALEIIGTPTATTLVAKATTSCSGDLVETFVQSDFVVKTTAGVAEPITAMTQVDGIYTLTGTFETGTIGTIVAETTNVMYEAIETNFTV